MILVGTPKLGYYVLERERGLCFQFTYLTIYSSVTSNGKQGINE